MLKSGVPMARAIFLAMGIASCKNSSGMSVSFSPWSEEDLGLVDRDPQLRANEHFGMIKEWPFDKGPISKNA